MQKNQDSKTIPCVISKVRACFSLVLVLISLTSCKALQHRPQRVELAVDHVNLPVTWCDHFILVQASINGRGPYHFLLDSGSPITFVTQETAADFPEATFSHSTRVIEADGSCSMQSKALRIDELKVGEVRICEFEALVMDMTNISDALGLRVDGLLSYTVFEGYLLVVDYPHQEVRVKWGRLSKAEGGNVLRSRFRSPDVRVSIGGKVYFCCIDTGGGGGFNVPDDLFDTLPKKAAPEIVSMRLGMGRSVRPTRAARLDGDGVLGTQVIREPILRSSIHDPYLGRDLLRHFCITFDCANGLIRFDSEAIGPIFMEPLRSHGVSFRRQGALWTVWQILPCALRDDLDLQEGDRVVKINGIPVGEIGSHASGLRKEGSGITLEVDRDGTRIEVYLPSITLVH